MSHAYHHCLHLLRQQNFDRYVATLFAPASKRTGIAALWAFDCEMARLIDRVKEPLMGEIRLRWWCDEIEKIDKSAQDGERASEQQNPLLFALNRTICQFDLSKKLLIGSCEARMRLLYGEYLDLEAYGQETAVVFFHLTCQVLAGADNKQATKACFHGGLADIYWRYWYHCQSADKNRRNEFGEDTMLEAMNTHYIFFSSEVMQLSRTFLPAFLPLAPLGTYLRMEQRIRQNHHRQLSPLRHLWRISRAALSGRLR